MMLSKARLATRISVLTLALFAVCNAALFAVQHNLYVRTFKNTLHTIDTSSMDVSRQAALGMTQSVRSATQRMLQTGEYKQFAEFAERQRTNAQIDQVAFAGAEGKIAHAAPVTCVGQSVDSGVLERAGQSDELIVTETDQSFDIYAPLRTDGDTRRLQPNAEVGKLYGVLCLKFSKDKINTMLAAATADFEHGVRNTLTWGTGVTLVGLIVVAAIMLLVVVRPLVGALNAAIHRLSERSDEMAQLSGQLAGSSQQLADGAGRQAASLEETSSALEQMAAMTHQNAEHARSANDLANQARTNAREGEGTMSHLTQAMQAINESAGQISKIIKVIEEIAFQTNLLALNAAVEAARAGEHGKGFAVVAEEVRNLAQRSAQAARDTTTLIEGSVSKAREGSEVTTVAASALQTIAGDVSKVAELLGNIAKASSEQAQGVEQINTAVSEMDRVTQENAAAAEESASGAQELSMHAGNVKGIVGELTSLVRGVRGTAAADSAVQAPPSNRELHPRKDNTNPRARTANSARTKPTKAAPVASRAVAAHPEFVPSKAEGESLSQF